MKKFLTYLAIIIIFAFLIPQIEAKSIIKKLNTRKIVRNGFEYVTKFGVNIGEGEYKYRYRLTKPLNKHLRERIGEDKNLRLNFMVLLDEDYEKITSETTCLLKEDWAKRYDHVVLNKDGDWSSWNKNDLSQSVRQHMWYFGFGTCDKDNNPLERYGFQVEVELVMYNSDGSHFSSEESGMVTLYGLLLLAFIGGLVYLVYKYNKMSSRDHPLIMLLVSFGLLFLSVFLYFIHLANYGIDGKGSILCQVFSSCLNISSQCVLTLLLMLLSWGWTVNQSQVPNKELLAPLVSLIIAVHLLIIGLGYINDDTDFRYHQYDGIIGVIVIFIRLVTLGYFAYQIKELLGKATGAFQEYVKQLATWGGFYFISVPISVILGSCLAYYLQHRFITIATLMFQLVAIVFLSFNFVSKKSGYGKVAMKNRTELPSAFGAKID